MLKENSAGIIIPTLVLCCSMVAFAVTLKSSRLLKSLFSSRKFQPINRLEVQIRPRQSLKSILKRLLPIYGLFTYKSIQYDMPGVGHIFQLSVYFLLVLGLNFYAVSITSGISYILGVFIGTLVTAVSVALCLVLHKAFISSFNVETTEIQVKVNPNSTVLDEKLRESAAGQSKDLDLVLALVLLAALSVLGSFLSYFHSTTADSSLILIVLTQSALSLLVDTPLRLLTSKILQKTALCPRYESKFPPVLINISAKDVFKLKLEEVSIEEPSDSFPHNDFSIPLDYSEIQTPKRNQVSMANHNSEHNESEPEQEFTEKALSRMSYDTIASHQLVSEDEDLLEEIIFCRRPKAKSPTKSLFNSPQKNSSPLKKKKNDELGIFMHLRQVSIDQEPNEEYSRDLDKSVGEKKDCDGGFKGFDEEMIGENYSGEENLKIYQKNQEFSGKFESFKGESQWYKDHDEIRGYDKEDNEIYSEDNENFSGDNEKFSENIENSFGKKEKTSEKSATSSGKKENFSEKNENSSEKKEKISEKSGASSGKKENSSEKNENSLGKKEKVAQKIEKTIIDKEENIEENKGIFVLEEMEKKQLAINPVYNFPKFEKNLALFESGSPFSHEMKIASKLPKQSKKSISLHRKILSFEEDYEVPNPVGMTQIISPLSASKENFEVVCTEEVREENPKFKESQNSSKPSIKIREASENSPKKPRKISKPLDKTIKDLLKNPSPDLQIVSPKEVSKAKSPSPPSKPRELINLKGKLSKDISLSSSSKSDSNSSINLSESSSSPQKLSKSPSKISNSNDLKKGPLILHKYPKTGKNLSEDESEDLDSQYRSRSQINRKSTKPPSRPSKSREHDREILRSGDFKNEGKVDMNFIKKMVKNKNLVKDKSVFKKKSNKKIMKNLEKILEGKENQSQDPEILRLKSMLASRQSFKKKHVELPKDHPYNQKIQTMLSDGSTPNEEYRIDLAALKKREERLKRISSIYSTRKASVSKESSKKPREKLSPSKSENVIKRKNTFL